MAQRRAGCEYAPGANKHAPVFKSNFRIALAEQRCEPPGCRRGFAVEHTGFGGEECADAGGRDLRAVVGPLPQEARRLAYFGSRERREQLETIKAAAPRVGAPSP